MPELSTLRHCLQVQQIYPAITGTWNPATIKYSNCRNNNLYLYSCCGSVCHYNNNGYCGNYFYYPDIYTDRTAMPELNRSGTASKFNKYSGHNRYMEPGYY